jgi:hypothetical protein
MIVGQGALLLVGMVVALRGVPVCSRNHSGPRQGRSGGPLSPSDSRICREVVHLGKRFQRTPKEAGVHSVGVAVPPKSDSVRLP